MTPTIDYFLAPQSPWTYLGHARIVRIARAHGARLHIRPFDLGGTVFPRTGGLPLAQRAPQRQAYRLVELARFSRHLGLPLNLHPRHFPVAGDDAARLLLAVDRADGVDAALALAGAMLAAVWVEERDIAQAEVLAQLLHATGLSRTRLDAAQQPDVDALYRGHTQAALDLGVFGAPSYVLAGEIFWGQDRLELLERALEIQAGAPAA